MIPSYLTSLGGMSGSVDSLGTLHSTRAGGRSPGPLSMLSGPLSFREGHIQLIADKKGLLKPVFRCGVFSEPRPLYEVRLNSVV